MKDLNKKSNLLDKEYQKLLKCNSDVPEERWDIYNEIITDCIEQFGEVSFAEIKYNLTDGTDINDVMLLSLDKMSDAGYYLKLRRDIIMFKNQDWIFTHTNIRKK